MEITQEIRDAVTAAVSTKLVSGLGEPEPGKMCIEAAVCFALGEAHGDSPSCVAEPDRSFAVALNDAAWSSAEARAEAMLPLALAQLGTAGEDRTEWVRAVALGTVQKVLSTALRASGLEANAVECEGVADLDTAWAAASAARYAARYAASAAGYAARYAASAAGYAASTAGDEALATSVQVALDAYEATSPRGDKESK